MPTKEDSPHAPREDEAPSAYDKLLGALEAHPPSQVHLFPDESLLEAAFSYRQLSELVHAVNVRAHQGDEVGELLLLRQV